jgi:Tfp pilus assembly protein PilF
MGMALKGRGQMQEATEHFKQALAINPTYLNSHFNLGILYEGIGNNDAALKEFRTVLQFNPTDH